jgi:hypothetical protein
MAHRILVVGWIAAEFFSALTAACSFWLLQK